MRLKKKHRGRGRIEIRRPRDRRKWACLTCRTTLVGGDDVASRAPSPSKPFAVVWIGSEHGFRNQHEQARRNGPTRASPTRIGSTTAFLDHLLGLRSQKRTLVVAYCYRARASNRLIQIKALASAECKLQCVCSQGANNADGFHRARSDHYRLCGVWAHSVLGGLLHPSTIGTARWPEVCTASSPSAARRFHRSSVLR